MFVFNNLTSRAISAAVLILGATIGYSIYTKGQDPSGLRAVVTKQNTNQALNNGASQNDLSGLMSASTTSFIPDSLTGLVGQNIFSTFTKVDTSNIAINDDLVDKVSKTFSDAIEGEPLVNFKEYTDTDLLIVGTPLISDHNNFAKKINIVINNYRNTFGALSKSNGSTADTEEAAIFSAMVKSAVVYKNLAGDLSSISVPIQEKEGFIDLLNSYSLSAAGLAEAKYYTSDPVRAGAGLQLHQQGAILEKIAIFELTKALKANGILFTLTPLSS